LNEGRIMSLNLAAYTLVHVVISLVGIVSGLVVLGGFLTRNALKSWTALFLTTTVATSATGYGFPFEHLLPSHIVGAISLVVLALAIYARYARHLAGAWRVTYVIGAVTALYFNVFVLVVQLFLKVPELKALAPTQSELPFAVAQLFVLVLFVFLGVLATKRSKEIQFAPRPASQRARA
jgi:hypothetical protein